jgi:ABC-type dipeptide/oligopeptide/nickel transport system permease component
MLDYIIRRLIQSVAILFGLSIFFFFLLHLSPGGPCDALATVGASQTQLERYHSCVERLGLNDPLPAQYFKWVTHVVHGDFGVSILDGTPVWDEIAARIPATLLLAGIAYIVTELIAIPLGIFAALRRYTFFDSVFTVVSYVGLSMPAFWLSGLLIVLFAITLGWLPAGGIVGDTASIPTFNGPGYWSYFIHHPWHAGTDFLQHLILPATVLAVLGIAVDSRFMRASMLEVIHQDYIRTARAKGLAGRTVIMKHALRNALLPIITNVALAIPALFGGAIIVETIFGWPGMGLLTIQALQSKNYPVLQTLLLIGALGVLVGNLLGDLAYAWVDPRIRYD